jgi:hypothetical protein
MADIDTLSEQAMSLLRGHLAAISRQDGTSSGKPTDQTLEAYRELARAGLMAPCHTFARGPESLYRITEQAYIRREELMAVQRRRFTPRAMARRILRAFSLMGKSVFATRSTT